MRISDHLLELLANPRPARNCEVLIHNPVTNTISIGLNIDGSITDELSTLAEFLEAHPEPNQTDLLRFCNARI